MFKPKEILASRLEAVASLQVSSFKYADKIRAADTFFSEGQRYDHPTRASYLWVSLFRLNDSVLHLNGARLAGEAVDYHGTVLGDFGMYLIVADPFCILPNM